MNATSQFQPAQILGKEKEEKNPYTFKFTSRHPALKIIHPTP
jgi:hypothetical protein